MKTIGVGEKVKESENHVVGEKGKESETMW